MAAGDRPRRAGRPPACPGYPAAARPQVVEPPPRHPRVLLPRADGARPVDRPPRPRRGRLLRRRAAASAPVSSSRPCSRRTSAPDRPSARRPTRYRERRRRVVVGRIGGDRLARARVVGRAVDAAHRRGAQPADRRRLPRVPVRRSACAASSPALLWIGSIFILASQLIGAGLDPRSRRRHSRSRSAARSAASSSRSISRRAGCSPRRGSTSCS